MSEEVAAVSAARVRLVSVAALLLGVLTAVFSAVEQWSLAGVATGCWLVVSALLVVISRTSPSQNDQDTGALVDRIASVEEAVRSHRPGKQMSSVVKSQTREVEALLQLYSWVDPKTPMPSSGPWSMNPQGLATLFGLVRRNRPRLVVELGSGTSTVWIGYALAVNGPVGVNGSRGLGRLISIDHESAYAEKSREVVQQHAEQVAPTEVRDAPLEPLTLGADHYRWYSLDALSDLVDIDMLIVDGPPSETGLLARYPAVAALADRLADGAVIVLDDATRDDEKAAADRWMSEHDGLGREESPIGRLAVFRYSAKKDEDEQR